MAADTILVIDAGTSALRALAVRADGQIMPIATEPWPMFVPADAAPFGREFEIAGVRRVLDRLLSAASPIRESVSVPMLVPQLHLNQSAPRWATRMLLFCPFQFGLVLQRRGLLAGAELLVLGWE